jgi:16S rRNA (cytosine1402-N4)-methyltransferase
VLFDLGVSSPQLDVPERGFSYRRDADLDMRMDPTSGRTAADVVNEYEEDDLVGLFADNGEGRFARRIARAIVAARPLSTTGELADVVRAAIPAATRRTGGHPARRVFQAIRIAVNEELDQLETALEQALGLLVPQGRCVVIAYHSGEDRLVKTLFTRMATDGCQCPPGLPCVCGADPQFRLVTRGARRPGPDEIETNPRAEAARLRVIERLPRESTRSSVDGEVA